MGKNKSEQMNVSDDKSELRMRRAFLFYDYFLAIYDIDSLGEIDS